MGRTKIPLSATPLGVVLSLGNEELVLDNMSISVAEVCNPVWLLHGGNYEEECIDSLIHV